MMYLNKKNKVITYLTKIIIKRLTQRVFKNVHSYKNDGEVFDTKRFPVIQQYLLYFI